MNMDIEKFAYRVLSEEGFQGWKVKLEDGGGGLCMEGAKVLVVGKFASPFMVLHEIAHIEAGGDVMMTFHNGKWADRFTALCDKYAEIV